jgi:hypothetical protein
VTYSWSGGGTNQMKTVSSSGTYTVTVTNNSNGCAASTFTVVTEDLTPPTPTASNNGPLKCNLTTVTLTASPNSGVTYSWSGGGTNQMKTVSSSGTYTVTVTNISNGCTASSSTAVTGDLNPPAITFTSVNNNTSCTNPNGSITANVGVGTFNYLWSNNQTTNTIINLFAGTYNVTVTNISNGCSTSKMQSITDPSPPPTPTNFMKEDPSTCGGTNGKISFGNGYDNSRKFIVEYKKDNITQSKTDVAPSGGRLEINGLFKGSYNMFRVKDQNSNCWSLVSTTTTILNDPSPPSLPSEIIVSPALICGTNNTINASISPMNGITYNWSVSPPVQNPMSSAGNYTFTVSSPNNYSISVSASQNNCTSTPRTKAIIVNPKPTATIAGPTSICERENLSLTALGGNTYEWNNSNGPSFSGQEYPLADLIDGSYLFTVTVTDTNGCTDTESHNLDVKNVPDMEFSLEQSGQSGIKSTVSFSSSDTENISKIIYTFFNNDGTQAGQSEEKSTLESFTRGGFGTGQKYNVEVKVTFVNSCEIVLKKSIILNSSDCGDYSPILKVNNQSLVNDNNIYKHSVCNLDSISLNFQATYNGLTKTIVNINNKNFIDENNNNKANINIPLNLVKNKINTFPISITYTYGTAGLTLTCNYSISIDNQLFPVITLDKNNFCFKKGDLKLPITKSPLNTNFKFNGGSPSEIEIGSPKYRNETYLDSITLTEIKAENNVCPQYNKAFTYRLYRTPEIKIISDLCKDDTIRQILNIDPKDAAARWSISKGSEMLSDSISGKDFMNTGDVTVFGFIEHTNGLICRTDTVTQNIKVKPLPSANISSYTKDCGPFYKVDNLGIVTNKDATYNWSLGTGEIIDIYKNKQIIGATGNGNLTLTLSKDGCYDHDSVSISNSTNFSLSQDTMQFRTCNQDTLFFIQNFKDGECYRWMYINSDGDIKEILEVDKPYVNLLGNNKPILVKYQCNTPCSGSFVSKRSTVSDHDCNDGQDTSKQADPLQIRPNPAFDLVELYSDNLYKGQYAIHIYDISGRQKIRFDLIHDGGKLLLPLDVSDWQVGMYFVTMGTETKKLIVIK